MFNSTEKKQRRSRRKTLGVDETQFSKSQPAVIKTHKPYVPTDGEAKDKIVDVCEKVKETYKELCQTKTEELNDQV